MSSRAERRRAAREKQWEPHDPAQHQSLGTVSEQAARHIEKCARCASGAVATFGCPWLRKFFARNVDVLGDLLGSGIHLDELDQYWQEKKQRQEDQHVVVDEDQAVASDE